MIIPADPGGCALFRRDFHDHTVLGELVQSPVCLAAVLADARDRIGQLDAALPRLTKGGGGDSANLKHKVNNADDV